MSVVYTSSNEIVKVVKINHVPSIISPANGSTVNIGTPSFTWGRAVGATTYQLVVSSDVGFSSPTIQVNLTSNSYSTPTPLTNGTYYWRVGAFEGNGFLGWSETAKFIVQATPSGGS